jgi:hypothetical protein
MSLETLGMTVLEIANKSSPFINTFTAAINNEEGFLYTPRKIAEKIQKAGIAK